MVILKDICKYLESVAPLSLQEDYDNAGLIIGNEKAKIKKALICLDCTEEILDEAIEKNCNLIIAHHPIVFRGIKKFNGNNYVERIIIKAIQNNINIYAAHTNLDNVLKNGVNQRIAKKLKLKNLKILSPIKGSQDKQGAGIVGQLSKSENERSFLKRLKTTMKTDCIRHTELLGKQIKKVAICGGSGSFLLNDAIKDKADIFITGDFKYHQFFDSDGKIVIADIGHYESEQFTKEIFYELLTKKFPKFAVHLTKINTNPINYYIN